MSARRTHRVAFLGAATTACGRDPLPLLADRRNVPLWITVKPHEVTCHACQAAEIRRAARPLAAP